MKSNHLNGNRRDLKPNSEVMSSQSKPAIDIWKTNSNAINSQTSTLSNPACDKHAYLRCYFDVTWRLDPGSRTGRHFSEVG